ncbi:MAG: NAD(P)-binding domain-containing protein [Solirubrobacterales bacterium]|nr:NAD(P)-binding domain-containing protein [Solirubrobacterales bacterium]
MSQRPESRAGFNPAIEAAPDAASGSVGEPGRTTSTASRPILREPGNSDVRPRVCVIGAGSSGMTACRSLAVRGIDFECYELGSETGGIWRYENDNERSAAYLSLHINTSRQMMSYAAHPMPDHYPDYPDHFQIADYFDDFIDRFGLRERITFNTEVTSVRPDGAHRWQVTLLDAAGAERTEEFTDVLVCSGHHWDARWPEPAFPGSDQFEGLQLHAHDYRTPDIFEGKRVLVLGIGNSATDISVEASRVADATFLAMRRGAWILPKYLFGRPTDRATSGPFTRAPIWIQSIFMWLLLRIHVGRLSDYGLPKPDHLPLQAHPTISDELLGRLGHGDITVKPNIDRLEKDTVVFTDGSRERIDVIVYCTGYRITFPFLSPEIIDTGDNRVDLYRRVASPEHEGLYFIGLIQPLGAIMPLAEAQAEWVAELVSGVGALPSRSAMAREIAIEQDRMKRRYVTSRRHTIQVDFEDYLRLVSAERERSRERALSFSASA